MSDLPDRGALIEMLLDQAPLLRLEFLQRRAHRHAGLAVQELLLDVLLVGDLVHKAGLAPVTILTEDEPVQRERRRRLLRLPLPAHPPDDHPLDRLARQGGEGAAPLRVPRARRLEKTDHSPGYEVLALHVADEIALQVAVDHIIDELLVLPQQLFDFRFGPLHRPKPPLAPGNRSAPAGPLPRVWAVNIQ